MFIPETFFTFKCRMCTNRPSATNAYEVIKFQTTRYMYKYGCECVISLVIH
jgi:hypothetical protein